MTELKMPQLKKLAKERTEYPLSFRLGVVGDCATQHISTAIKGMGAARNIGIEVFDSDYNQIMPQTSDGESELYAFTPDGVLIFMCTEKLYEKFTETPADEKTSFAEKIIGEIRFYWQNIRSRCGACIIQPLFREYDDRVYGNYSVNRSFIYQLRKLNLMICDEAASFGKVYTVDTQYIANYYSEPLACSSKMYGIAKLPLSVDAIPAFADSVVSIICAARGRFKKCVVLDLDNTLWGGVIGDCGLDGIELGELGTGHAFTAFQTWLKELKKRGIILAVCSKNDEDKAKEPFIKHPDMVLRLEDIAIFVANWDNKPSNIRFIQQTLNIGMDSMVFIDDNPFEREAVRSMIPEITVPDIPEDPAEYVDFLRSENLFETISYSAADADRTEMYRAEADRKISISSFDNYDDYLASLEMKAEALPFSRFWYPRIAQLSQRSNQFNLRTVRYTEEDIKRIAESDDCLTVYYTLEDKFGDYGLISAVIMKKTDEKTLFIDTWIMSCRVLKRGMEEFIVDKLMSVAAENGFEKVVGEYLPTAKNGMVKEIYAKEGFLSVGEGIFTADVKNYQHHRTFIKEK